MLFPRKPRDARRWRKRFAFLPTTVGSLPDGKAVRVWLKLYEVRLHPFGDHPIAKERRPLQEIPKLKHYGADMPIAIYGFGFPWLAP